MALQSQNASKNVKYEFFENLRPQKFPATVYGS